jgi:hypothetical protein
MKNSKKATSIAEAIVVLMVITTWVTWMYYLYNKSTILTNSTANKIKAIEIARQWIEAFTNIRDSNWIKFSGDFPNCWNVKNYNTDCIWDETKDYDIASWSYIIYKKIDNSWKLETKETGNFWSWYINNFKVWLNDKWIYTQTWITTKLKPIFTRELQVSYLTDEWTIWDSNDNKIKIFSLVQWIDNGAKNTHKIKLEQILSNRKK